MGSMTCRDTRIGDFYNLDFGTKFPSGELVGIGTYLPTRRRGVTKYSSTNTAKMHKGMHAWWKLTFIPIDYIVKCNTLSFP